MRQRVFMSLAVCAVLSLASSIAFAQSGHPSAKATTQAIDVNVMGTEEAYLGQWGTILTNTIHTSAQKDLFINASLECGVMTRNQVKSKGGNKETSVAESGVEVQVLVDGQPAAPGPVTFCSRRAELSATFQGLLDGCTSINEDGQLVIDEALCEPEEVELILDTMSASSFGFVADNLGTGVHRVEVQARIRLSEQEASSGSAEARACIGKGSVSVEEVRLVQGENIDF